MANTARAQGAAGDVLSAVVHNPRITGTRLEVLTSVAGGEVAGTTRHYPIVHGALLEVLSLAPAPGPGGASSPVSSIGLGLAGLGLR